MARSILKTVISLGAAFAIPVKVFPGAVEKNVAFNTLHAECNSRLKQKRWCPTCDREVFSDEVYRAYEYSSDNYIAVSDEDLDNLPVEAKHLIQLTAFVGENELGREYVRDTYWLEPEAVSRKPYALLMRGLRKRKAAAVGTVVLRNVERMAFLRATERGIILETVYWPDEVRYDDMPQLPDVLFRDEELGLIDTVIRRLSEPFNPAAFKDTHRETLLNLIAARAEKNELAPAAPIAVPKPTTDLMAALKATLAGLKPEDAAASLAEPEPAAEEAAPAKRTRKKSAAA